MNRSRSLQWRLTIITAFIVTLSSLAMRYAISKAAIHSMGEIEDSAISIFPSTDADDDFSGEMLAIELNPRELLSDSIKKNIDRILEEEFNDHRNYHNTQWLYDVCVYWLCITTIQKTWSTN